MKKVYLVSILMATVLASYSAKKGSYAKETDIDGNKVINCNMSDVKDTIDLLLSDVIEKCEFIPLQTTEKSLFESVYHVAISDNYIAIHSRGQSPIKLFDRKGKFISDIGAIGHGPGEYLSLSNIQLDEVANKIYLTPFANASKLIVYSLNNEYLYDIPLKYRQTKCYAYVKDNKVTVLSMPFKDTGGKSIPIAYQQTLKGELIQEVAPAENQLINPRNKEGQMVGFNSEISSSFNNGAYDLFILPWGMEPNNTLYYYNTQKNVLEPKFMATFTGKSEGTWIREWKNHYWAFVFGDKFKGAKVVVDKNTLKSNFFRVKNDFYGNIEMYKFYMSNNGWFINSVAAISLIERIETALENKKLSSADKAKLKDLLNRINENDNDVLFVGKMK